MPMHTVFASMIVILHGSVKVSGPLNTMFEEAPNSQDMLIGSNLIPYLLVP